MIKWLNMGRNIIAAFLVVAVMALGQSQSAAAQTVVFSSISISGNQRIETGTIRSFAALKSQTPLTPGQINDAYQRLIATGLFEEVTITPRGDRLTIVVREYPTINRINFERNKRLKDEALAEVITSQSRRTYSPAQAEADAAAIVEAYRNSGRFTAEVTPVIIRRPDNRVDLVFEIFEGKVVEVQRLSFVGNRNFSDRRLRQILSTKQAGLFRGFVRSDTFIADRVEFDKQLLRDFYLSRGFIDFEVLSAASEVARQRNGFFVTFRVREGQAFKFGKITTSSELTEVDPADYQEIIRIKPGVTYSPALLDETIGRMEELATQKALNFIRVLPRVTRNDGSRTLDIEFVVSRGPRVFVERIDIEGNTTTLDRVIRRQFITVEGDPFNPRQIRAASDRIRALGFFASTEINSREGSSPGRVIVDVNVEDQPTGSLSFGVSYGAAAGFGGTMSLSESNFLGRGQFIKIELGGGVGSKDVDLTFAEPAFLSRDLRLELGAYYRTSVQQDAFYDTVFAGFEPKIEFPLSQNGRFELRYRGSSDTISNVSAASSPIITADVGTVSTSSIGFSYIFDNRTTGLNPTAGTIIRLSQEFAGIGGQAKYSKTSGLVGGRMAVGGEDVVLTAELEGGFLLSPGGASRVTDRFFLNTGQFRGFQRNGMGPRDVAATGGAVNNDALGGNAFAVARLEATFPLGFIKENGVFGGLFLDVGSVWSLDNTTGAGGIGSIDDSANLRAVIGVSLFWDTPVGPLRFNFSRALLSQAYDIPENFELTIGKRF